MAFEYGNFLGPFADPAFCLGCTRDWLLRPYPSTCPLSVAPVSHELPHVSVVLRDALAELKGYLRDKKEVGPGASTRARCNANGYSRDIAARGDGGRINLRILHNVEHMSDDSIHIGWTRVSAVKLSAAVHAVKPRKNFGTCLQCR